MQNSHFGNLQQFPLFIAKMFTAPRWLNLRGLGSPSFHSPITEQPPKTLPVDQPEIFLQRNSALWIGLACNISGREGHFNPTKETQNETNT